MKRKTEKTELTAAEKGKSQKFLRDMLRQAEDMAEWYRRSLAALEASGERS
jgi:hypothetical protein